VIDVPSSDLFEKRLTNRRSILVPLAITQGCQLDLVLGFEFRLPQRPQILKFFSSDDLRIFLVVPRDLFIRPRIGKSFSLNTRVIHQTFLMPLNVKKRRIDKQQRIKKKR
jgi:hypothetical protein